MIQQLKAFRIILCLILMGPLLSSLHAYAEANEQKIPMLANPISVNYLEKKLRKSLPRLVLNDKTAKNLKERLKADPIVKNMYKTIQLNANSILDQPLLTRKLIGKRLLWTSRDMLWRVNMLGMVYYLEKDKRMLDRLNDELIAVSTFSDWNPSHFLDVGEMSLAVALALDWSVGDLPPSTIKMAKTALIDKGIKPSWPDDGSTPEWAYGANNWNQVCHAGMIAASIAIAEEDPELASKTIHRALDGMPHALAEYGPDGVYPEGTTYWLYGTSFSVTTAAMLESAFGHDFGFLDYPAFKKSAIFRVLSNAPSGWYYNFSDSRDKRRNNGDITLAWFAAKTGNSTFLETERFLRPPEKMDKLDRLSGAALVWLAQYRETDSSNLPSSWKGNGPNPIVIFTGEKDNPHQYYFGGKGGRGMLSHGNMDGGSFVFELNGVRWVVDPGNQQYHELEKTGFELWNNCQTCERWTLLTKNNFGHSTITINNELHKVDGQTTLTTFKDGKHPEATFDMSAAFGDLASKVTRKFLKDSSTSLVIEDSIVKSNKTELITWQLMTKADVKFVKGGALLYQEGKSLRVENLSHPKLGLNVISLYPAPMALDRQIENLKRLEIRIPAWSEKEDTINIKVRLTSE